MKNEDVKQCISCVMDSTDPDIQFDTFGVCNYCLNYSYRKSLFVPNEGPQKLELPELVRFCMNKGKGKSFDCVIGVSGGVDSTYVAYLVKQLGLRPLAVHLDNGWNSELAISNIRAALQKLDIELQTYVLDWEEFRNLQLAFLKASTPDSEIPTDHAIVALLRKIANEENLPVIWGVNFSSEAILPKAWSQGHMDWTYIRNVNRKFGKQAIKTFPHYSIWRLIYYNRFRRQRLFNILNLVDYNKEVAKRMLESEIGWRDYGGKHYESVYTRIFQSYILPVKFGYDKRKAHYSSLILAGQMSRNEALHLLESPPFDKDTIDADIQYLIKKLQISGKEFDEIMSLPLKTYHDYRSKWVDSVKHAEKLIFKYLISVKKKVFR